MPTTYTITFDTRGAAPIAPIVLEEGEPVPFVENPTLSGFDFVEWDPPRPPFMPDEDLLIVAIWEVAFQPLPEHILESGRTSLAQPSLDGAPVGYPHFITPHRYAPSLFKYTAYKGTSDAIAAAFLGGVFLVFIPDSELPTLTVDGVDYKPIGAKNTGVWIRGLPSSPAGGGSLHLVDVSEWDATDHPLIRSATVASTWDGDDNLLTVTITADADETANIEYEFAFSANNEKELLISAVEDKGAFAMHTYQGGVFGFPRTYKNSPLVIPSLALTPTTNLNFGASNFRVLNPTKYRMGPRQLSETDWGGSSGQSFFTLDGREFRGWCVAGGEIIIQEGNERWRVFGRTYDATNERLLAQVSQQTWNGSSWVTNWSATGEKTNFVPMRDIVIKPEGDFEINHGYTYISATIFGSPAALSFTGKNSPATELFLPIVPDGYFSTINHVQPFRLKLELFGIDWPSGWVANLNPAVLDMRALLGDEPAGVVTSNGVDVGILTDTNSFPVTEFSLYAENLFGNLTVIGLSGFGAVSIFSGSTEIEGRLEDINDFVDIPNERTSSFPANGFARLTVI